MAEFTASGAAPTANDGQARAVTVTPRVDVLELEGSVLVLADMPGVRPDDVDVRFEKGELTIHGRRPAPHAAKEPARREYAATNYYRTFGVAETIAADKITADLKAGVLTITLPKVEAVKPRKIAVSG